MILYVSLHLDAKANGASKSNRIILEEIGKRYPLIAYYSIGDDELNTIYQDNHFQRYRARYNHLLAVLRSGKYKFVITQNRIAYKVIEVAKAPVMFQVREAYNLICEHHVNCPDSFKNGYRQRNICSKECWSKNPIWQRNVKAMEKAEYVIANSKYMKDLIIRFFGEQIQQKIQVIYPPVLKPENTKTKRKTILFAGNQPRKGYDLFLEMAKKDQSHLYAIAGNSDITKPMDNLILYGNLADMHKAYGEAKIVVCCDQEAPAFNRIPREAGYYGIPAVASNIGGLPESVGRGGILIDDYTDVNSFISAIGDIEKKYDDYSIEAERLSTTSDTVKDFVEIVDNSLNSA